MNLKIQDLLLNSKEFRLRCLEDEKARDFMLTLVKGESGKGFMDEIVTLYDTDLKLLRNNAITIEELSKCDNLDFEFGKLLMEMGEVSEEYNKNDLSNVIKEPIKVDETYKDQFKEDKFLDKLKKYFKKLGYNITYEAMCLYHIMMDKNTPLHAKAIIASTLGYFVAPMDFIPDIAPGIGLADDASAISACLATFNHYKSEEIQEKVKIKLNSWFGVEQGEIDTYTMDDYAKVATVAGAVIIADDILMQLLEDFVEGDFDFEDLLYEIVDNI